jgi:hypothetical protein
MDLAQREGILYRIFSGTTRLLIDGKRYIFKNPTAEDKYTAQEMYQQEIKRNRYENWHTKKTVLNFLQEQDIFTQEDEDRLKKMEDDIEELKFQLFTSMLNVEKSKFIRLTLSRTRTIMSNLISAKGCLDHTTKEGYASLVKTQYLTSRSLFDEDSERLPNSACAPELIEKAMLEVSRSSVSQAELRELARSEPWRAYWGSSGKQGVFSGIPIDYTEDQRSLILYSKMYDGAYEHPECPDDDVINDDDLFDGWMIHQRRQREGDKKKKSIEASINEKQRNAEELYVVAPDTKEANKINELNSPSAKNKRRRRDINLRKKGTMREAELPDKKQEIIMQANRQFADKFKG